MIEFRPVNPVPRPQGRNKRNRADNVEALGGTCVHSMQES